MSSLCSKLAATEAELAFDTRCDALYRSPDGTILGARLKRFGEERRIRARGGVIVTTGGFVLNDDMLDAYSPEARLCSMRVAADGDDQEGLRLEWEQRLIREGIEPGQGEE